jgi:UDP:flavonoid glycosyltransferase YjiC (YdhE family)
MSRILLAWELGANLGHIDRQLVIARALREHGHEPVFVLRDLSRAYPRVAAAGFRIGQAPVWLPRLNQPPRQGNFTNVLTAAGWLDPAGLAGLVAGWQSWLDLVQPDALLVDHAPTALLAARGLGVPVWACGSGFEIPPAVQGCFAPFFPDRPADAQACPGWDAALLPTVNAALAMMGRGPLQRLTEIFDGVGKAMLTLPELSHYGDQGAQDANVHWVGPIYADGQGVHASWPAGDGARVFVYVEPGHPDFEALIGALRAQGVRALVHAKGLAPQAAQRLGGGSVRFEAAPVRMDEAMAGADAVICHGGQGTLAAALLAGKPVLVVPTQLEQAMAARRLVAGGLGVAVELGTRSPTYGPLVRRVLTDTALAAAARATAARHAGHSPSRTAERVAALVQGSLRR